MKGVTRGDYWHFSTGSAHRLDNGGRVSSCDLTYGLRVVVESLRVIFLAVECISLLFEPFRLTAARKNRKQRHRGTHALPRPQ